MTGLSRRSIGNDNIILFDYLIVAIIALLARISYWFIQGTSAGKDTEVYTGACGTWFSKPWLLSRPINSGFTLPFCTVTEVLNLSWDYWILVQILLSVVACLLVYSIAIGHLGRIAGLVGGLSMAVMWESFQWDVYVLTDSLFVFFVTLALWAVSRHHRNQTRRTFWVAWIAIAMMVFTRAHGLPIAAGWFLLDFLPRDHRYRLNLISRPLHGIVILAIGLGVFGFQYYGFVTGRLLEWYAQGLLVWDEPMLQYPWTLSEHSDPLSFVLFNLHHILLISILRVMLFFNPIMPRWSTLHILVNIVTLIPTLIASLWAIVHSLRNDRELFLLWALPLVMLLLVIALTHVDWDWRYRAPAAPMFSLLTGYTVWVIWQSDRVQRYIR